MAALLQLFASFTLIGLGAYGGGLVTIPLIQHEVVTVRGWLAAEEMSQLLAVAQMTPGPIAINGATFVGYRVAGIPGAVVSTVAVLLPSLLILAVLVRIVDRIAGSRHVGRVRGGLQIGVLSLILFAVWSYGAVVVTGWREFALAAGAFGVLVATEGKVQPALVILGCGVLGVALF